MTKMRPHRIKVGDRVQVCFGSGLESGTVGRVIPRSEVPTNERGVPKVEGCYRPMQPNEVAIRTEGGRIIIMFKSRLIKLD